MGRHRGEARKNHAEREELQLYGRGQGAAPLGGASRLQPTQESVDGMNGDKAHTLYVMYAAKESKEQWVRVWPRCKTRHEPRSAPGHDDPAPRERLFRVRGRQLHKRLPLPPGLHQLSVGNVFPADNPIVFRTAPELAAACTAEGRGGNGESGRGEVLEARVAQGREVGLGWRRLSCDFDQGAPSGATTSNAPALRNATS